LTVLQVLDGEALTAEAREAAQLTLHPPEPPVIPLLNDPTKVSPYPHVSPQSVQVDVGMMTRLKAMLVEARRTVKARRILMMPVRPLDFHMACRDLREIRHCLYVGITLQ
jgi:hypothetical protein